MPSALLATIDHTDVIVTSATELVKALLVFFGVLATAGLGIGIPVRRKALKERRTQRATLGEVHEQLHNDHPKNFRVEIDEKFDAVNSNVEAVNTKADEQFREIMKRLDRQSADIGVIKKSSLKAATDAAAAKKAATETRERLNDHIDGR